MTECAKPVPCEHCRWRPGLPVFTLILVLAVTIGCSRDTSESHEGSLAPAAAGSVIFQPGIVSTGLNERDATMTPDGTEFYFSIWTGSFGVIAVSRQTAGHWGRPEVAAFSGTFSDLEPSMTPDGSRLYFASTRPAAGDSAEGDYNIWYVDRDGSSWSQPGLVDRTVNSPGSEYYPSVTSAGELYFTSEREGGAGGEDIWRALPTDSGLTRVEPVPGGVNTDHDEFNAYIAPDGSYLIFSSWGRDDGMGGGDLYISFRDTQGAFGPAVNMGPSINSAGLEYCPYVSPDGRDFYFSSRRATFDRRAERWTYADLRDALGSAGNGLGDIFVANASVLDSLRATIEP